MNERTSTATNGTPLMRTTALITIVGASLFVILLVLLHFLEPEFDPSWRLISEYELGNYGWLMRIAFYSLAVGSISLFVAIRSQIRGIGGVIGLVLLLVIAVGLALGGFFTTDPITTPADAHSTSGSLHGLGGGLSFPFIPIAALLITLNLARRNQAWKTARAALHWSNGLIWLSFLSLIVIEIVQYQPVAGPELIWGWSNRAVMVAYAIWLIVVARHALRVVQKTPAA